MLGKPMIRQEYDENLPTWVLVFLSYSYYSLSVPWFGIPIGFPFQVLIGVSWARCWQSDCGCSRFSWRLAAPHDLRGPVSATSPLGHASNLRLNMRHHLNNPVPEELTRPLLLHLSLLRQEPCRSISHRCAVMLRSRVFLAPTGCIPTKDFNN